MIIRHYEVFKSELGSQELNQENWDVLRTESKESAYAIEDNVEQYEKNCLSCVSYEVAAGRILDVLKEHHCGHVVSMGIGYQTAGREAGTQPCPQSETGQERNVLRLDIFRRYPGGTVLCRRISDNPQIRGWYTGADDVCAKSGG